MSTLEDKAAEIATATGQDHAIVLKVLTALDTQAGEDVGAVRRNPDTGEVAHRVMDGDIRKWRISHPTEGLHYDMNPTLPWAELT